MSRIAERVIRRLIRDHGYVFELDPSKYRCAVSREAVAANHYGGLGTIQWCLQHERSTGLAGKPCRIKQMRADGTALWVTAEIGGIASATELLCYDRWDVEYEGHPVYAHTIDPALNATKHERIRKART